MKRFTIISLFCCLFVTIAWAQDQFNLSGTIKNQADFKVFGLICELVEAGHVDTTDSSGAFNVTGDATAIVSTMKKAAPTPQFKGSQIFIPVTSGVQPVSVEIYNVKGSKVATVFNKTLPQGEHTIPFANRLNTVSQSVLIAVVKCGSNISKFRLIKAGSRGFIAQEFGGGASGNSQTLATASLPLQVLDSLRFKRCLKIEGQQEELIEFAIPITKLEDEFKVILDLIPYEALEWGKTQEGRSNETVGQELGKPGSGIYPYEFQTYYNGAWCSEFHSYMMRVGGCPLGDDEGSATRPHWLHLGHDGLERWYNNNSDQKTEFVDQKDIVSSGYVPVTGDFVHVGGHTTTVRYVTEDNILYTVGGNEGDKVKLAKRGNYVNWSSTLWGYGRRSGVTGNSWESVR